ncbi:MAG: hypothetical protein PHC50_05485, partial [Candidatus Cloacimonetes bacterium]|nr:hypothetical protein [Candidatus Cloacimonadota bacterium]
VRPTQTYTSVRRWLINADDVRFNTIWQTLKKLANIHTQKSKKDKGNDFMSITKRTVQEWKQDPNPQVQNMGNKLGTVIHLRSRNNAPE